MPRIAMTFPLWFCYCDVAERLLTSTIINLFFNEVDAEYITKMKLGQHFMNKGYYFQKVLLDNDTEPMVSNRQYDTETQFQWRDIEEHIT